MLPLRPLTVFWYASGISKVDCYLKVKVTLYTMMQTPTQKWKPNTEIADSWNPSSEMFQKIGIQKFWGKHACWRPLLSRCTACNLQVYSLQLASLNVIEDSIKTFYLQIFWKYSKWYTCKCLISTQKSDHWVILRNGRVISS